jgi:polyketide cyclase/dehydrase/lipid transport protein
MASVIREIIIEASPDLVWAAVGDFADGPLQMSGGAFTDCRMDRPDVRTLTFADGTEASERLIARDEQARRIVWGWVGDERVEHDNTSMQVFAEGEARSRLVWIHDTLPAELTGWLATAMDQLAPVFQESLRSHDARHSQLQ